MPDDFTIHLSEDGNRISVLGPRGHQLHLTTTEWYLLVGHVEGAVQAHQQHLRRTSLGAYQDYVHRTFFPQQSTQSSPNPA